MGVDQLVTGGDFDDPVVDSLTSDSVKTDILNNGATITDGDGTERQVYIIASGASDPADADPEDLILEEQ